MIRNSSAPRGSNKVRVPLAIRWGGVFLGLFSSCGGSASSEDSNDVGSEPGQLEVFPAEAFICSGMEGGPFFPSSKLYVLSNGGNRPMVWSIPSSPGLLFSLASGQLEAGEVAVVEVSVDEPMANQLDPGLYVGKISFLNATNGLGGTQVPSQLTINAGGVLAIDPGVGFTSTGPVGGPFAPSSSDYTLTNTGAVPVDWSITLGESWLATSSTGGTLEPDGQASVTLSIVQPQAGQLPAGGHVGSALFRDDTNGLQTEIFVALESTVSPTLAVTPGDGFSTAGSPGGPFVPATKTYTLSNAGTGTLSWSGSANQSWVRLTPPSGTLAPGGQVGVVVSIDAAATSSMGDGAFAAQVSFTNQTNGQGNTARIVNLLLTSQAAMAVTPTTPFGASGPVGGPFSPAQLSYQVAHTAGGAVTWAAESSQNWLMLNSGGGSLQPGQSFSLTASIDQGIAGGLPVGIHSAQIQIVNQTTGVGSVLIGASVDVSSGGPTQAPVLVAGSGFTGPTPEPPPVGSGRGVDARAIARWDVVPHQSFSGDFNVGVVAFHMNGIARVEFSIHGGPWAAVSTMTLNPRTGVHEYWAIARAQGLPAGPVELRAVAYPRTGLPRVLPPLLLHANPNAVAPIVSYVSPTGNDSTADGTRARPYRTMFMAAIGVQSASPNNRADGGIVYMEAGDYIHGPAVGGSLNTQDTWLTFQPAPGVATSAVRITDNEHPGVKTHLSHYKNLTLTTSLTTSTTPDTLVWLDGCELQGPGQFVDWHAAGWLVSFDEKYLTGCNIRDDSWGVQGAHLQRDVHCERIGSDAFGPTKLLINCSVDGIDRGSNTDWHPDAYDITNRDTENNIVYGLRVTNAESQGLFFKDIALKDFAVVNVLIDAIGGSTTQFHKMVSLEHILFYNVTIYGQVFLNREIGSWKYFVMKGCSLKRMDGDVPPSDQLDIVDNHYTETVWTLGSGFTVGDPMYVNPGNDDFRLQAGSPLRGRMPRQANTDLAGNPRAPVGSSIGAYE